MVGAGLARELVTVGAGLPANQLLIVPPAAWICASEGFADEPALAGPAPESCTSDVLDTRRGQPYQIDVGGIQRMVGGRHGQIGAGQLA